MLTPTPSALRVACSTLALIMLMACNNSQPEAEEPDITEVRNMEHDELVQRGSYLVTAGHCNDCHTPKKMTPNGPVDDSANTLVGHLANSTLPPIDEKALKPGNWVLFSPGFTAFVGPWGTSYTANLTPDSATGIGAWTEEVFVKTLRTGKHLGQDNGRQILPPMPWYNVAKLSDQDIKAIYTYLRTIPPINNRVPAPLSPEETIKLARSAGGPVATTRQ
jgi:mono/diheme cytochrome c family protein